jgi:hypothetical protein
MDYQEYIDLGFKRTDMNDNVEFKQTGYYGFALEKKFNKKMTIGVSSGELDKPKLYIKMRNQSTYHIITINGEMVRDLLSKENSNSYSCA